LLAFRHSCDRYISDNGTHFGEKITGSHKVFAVDSMVRNIIIGKISAQAKCSLEFASWGNNPLYSLLIEPPLQSVHVSAIMKCTQ